jgi:hypothetical protein
MLTVVVACKMKNAASSPAIKLTQTLFSIEPQGKVGPGVPGDPKAVVPSTTGPHIRQPGGSSDGMPHAVCVKELLKNRNRKERVIAFFMSEVILCGFFETVLQSTIKLYFIKNNKML